MLHLFSFKRDIKSLFCLTLSTLTCLTALPVRPAAAEGSALVAPSVGQPRAAAASFGSAPAQGAPDATRQARVNEAYGRLPLSFEVNQGQTDPQVKFLSRGSGYTFFLTADEAVMTLHQPPARGEGDEARRARKGAPGRDSVLRMRLEGASTARRIEGLEELAGKSNYFSAGDPSRWHANVAQYARVRYAQVYPGVDLVYYGNQRELEYDFVVAPGADTSAIGLRFKGARKIELSAAGDLVLQTGAGRIVQHKPVAYQQVGGARREVACGYALDGKGRVGFRVGAYDRSAQLVIDPVLAYSTLLGSSYVDYGNAIAVDAAGNAYVTGQAFAPDFPVTPGAYQTVYSGHDAFVTKINPQGTALVYSTFLTGAEGTGIAVDAAGNAYVTGDVGYLGFPVTPGAFQTPQSGFDTFITKLNPTGSALVYSSRFGGTFDDFGRAIALDSAGNAYITGWTVCAAPGCDFPTVNAFQPTYGGGNNDAFVTKMNPQGTALVYSTYLGGGHAFINNADDWGEGIAVDSAGSAYVTGYTYSPDFPITPGAFDASWNGLDAFVTKFTPDGSALVYSTFLGGRGADYGRAIAVDSAGSAYVTGETDSQDSPFTAFYEGFPVTPGAFQPAGSFDAYVTKMNPQGTGLVYSTYLGGVANESGTGGNGVDRGWGIAVDGAGQATVIGDTRSPNFPTFNPVQPGPGGNPPDAFVTKFNAQGTAPVFSTYLGGNGWDEGRGVALDPAGDIYVVGSSSSYDFPVTPGAFQTFNKSGHDDAFVTKIADTGNTSNWLSTFNISPALITAGGSSQGSVTINAPAPAGGAVVTLTNGRPDIANVPSSVTVQAGSTGAVFQITTGPSFWQGRAGTLITASYGGVTRSNTLAVDAAPAPPPPPAVSLSGITFKQMSVTGGTSSKGVVSLSAAAPAGGVSVALNSSNVSVASVPASVTVPAGATSVAFAATTRAVTSSTTVTISAAYGGASRAAAVNVTAQTSPPPPTATDTVSITRADFTGSKNELRVEATGSSGSATLTLYVAATGALIGTLTNNGGGKYAGQFVLKSNPLSVTVKSSLGGSATRAVALK